MEDFIEKRALVGSPLSPQGFRSLYQFSNLPIYQPTNLPTYRPKCLSRKSAILG